MDVETQNTVKFILSIITFIYDNLIVLLSELTASVELCSSSIAYWTPEDSRDKITP